MEESVVQASIIGGRFGVKDYPRLFFLPNREQGDPIGPSLLVSTEMGGHWDETWRGAVEVLGEFIQTALPHFWFFRFKEFRVLMVLFRAVDLLHVKTGSFSLNGKGISIIPSFPWRVEGTVL